MSSRSPSSPKPSSARFGGARSPANKGSGGKNGGGNKGSSFSDDQGDDEPKRKLGGERNVHGTRTARRIRCTRCKKVDHVPGGPRDPDKVLCRACVAEVLEILEVGVEEEREMRPATCTLCAKKFDLPAIVKAEAEDILCPDCLRGFSTWQGPIDKPSTREVDLGKERRPGVRLRSGPRKKGDG